MALEEIENATVKFAGDKAENEFLNKFLGKKEALIDTDKILKVLESFGIKIDSYPSWYKHLLSEDGDWKLEIKLEVKTQ